MTGPATPRPAGLPPEVLVVGAGPAGLTTAIGLARRKVRVLVVDRHSGPSSFPKASGVRPRSMEIFRSWGLDDRVEAAAQDVRLELGVSSTFSDPPLAVEPVGVPDEAYLGQVTPSRFRFVPQDSLEPVLLDELRALGVDVRFGTELVDLTQVDGGVLARLSVQDGPAVDHGVVVRYLVGADGARSRVRDLVGIRSHHLGTEGHHVAVLFGAELDAVLPGPRFALRWATVPGAEGLLVASGDNRWTYDWAVTAPSGDGERAPAVVARRLARAIGRSDVSLDVQRVFPWSMGAEVADAFRARHVLLVGDSAHRTTPRGATGMNTGVAAAHNLAWKLAWVLRGWAGEELLDSYETERLPVARMRAEESLRARGDLPEEPGAVDFGVTYTVPGADGPGAGRESTRPGLDVVVGRRAPHAWLTGPDGRRRSTLDLFDAGLTVLTGPAGDEWLLAVPRDPSTPPVRVLRLGVDLPDPDRAVTELYGVQDGGAVLVRPDGHVAWQQRRPRRGAELATAVARATAHPRLHPDRRTTLTPVAS